MFLCKHISFCGPILLKAITILTKIHTSWGCLDTNYSFSGNKAFKKKFCKDYLLIFFCKNLKLARKGHWCGRKLECPKKPHVFKRATLIPFHIQQLSIDHGDRNQVAAVRSECIFLYVTLTILDVLCLTYINMLKGTDFMFWNVIS